MAQLPGMGHIIQQIDGEVVLFQIGTEEELVRFDPSDANATARAQFRIYESDLGAEDKCFAHFWSGYFYAYATGGMGHEREKPLGGTTMLEGSGG